MPLRAPLNLSPRQKQGTFSQRHAILTDQKSERAVVPLETLRSSPPSGANSKTVGAFEVVNSSLSEYAVVGFEQGVAWVTPKLLPIWEAQVSCFTRLEGAEQD